MAQETWTLSPKVDLPNLMLDTAKQTRSSTVASGFQLATVYLNTIRDRALELKDPAILEALCNLGFLNKEPKA